MLPTTNGDIVPNGDVVPNGDAASGGVGVAEIAAPITDGGIGGALFDSVDDDDDEADADLFGRLPTTGGGMSSSGAMDRLATSGLLGTAVGDGNDVGGGGGLFDELDADEERKRLAEEAARKEAEELERLRKEAEADLERRRKDAEERDRRLAEDHARTVAAEQAAGRARAVEEERQRQLQRISQAQQKMQGLALGVPGVPRQQQPPAVAADGFYRPRDPLSSVGMGPGGDGPTPAQPHQPLLPAPAPFVAAAASGRAMSFAERSAHMQSVAAQQAQEQAKAEAARQEQMKQQMQYRQQAHQQQAQIQPQAGATAMAGGYGAASYYYSTAGGPQQQQPQQSLQPQITQQVRPEAPPPMRPPPNIPQTMVGRNIQPQAALGQQGAPAGPMHGRYQNSPYGQPYPPASTATVHSQTRRDPSLLAGLHNGPDPRLGGMPPLDPNAPQQHVGAEAALTQSLVPAIILHDNFQPLYGRVTVSDPLLVQAHGLFAGPPHWTYAVTVCVQGGDVRSRAGVQTIRRRFRHIVALEDRLRECCPGTILPPR